MSQKIYKYPRRSDSYSKIHLGAIGEGLFLLFGFLLSLIGIFSIFGLFLALIKGGVNSQGQFLAGLLLPIFCIFFQLAGIYIFFRFPNLEIRNDGFRLRKPLISSNWIGWDAIQSIEESRMGRDVRNSFGGDWKAHNVEVPNLGIQYAIIGFFLGIDGRGFMISNQIHRYDEVMGRFQTYRPDLFENEIL